MTSLQFDRAKWIDDSEGTWFMFRVKFPMLAKKFVAEIKDRLYTAEIKEYREKRSLDANALYWVLCDKLSEKIGISKEKIYRQHVKDIGGNTVILPIRDDAKEQFIHNWQGRGIGWPCDEIGESKLTGYTNVICYYGSSTYDSAQMSRLIQFIVQDCKDQGIETLTPNEISLIVESWDSGNAKHG